MNPLPKLIVFDLDDTLVESKQPLESEMAELLQKLLARTRVAIITGGHMPRFQEQFLPHLDQISTDLQNLILAPTCGAALYAYTDAWQLIYEHPLSDEDIARITRTFETCVYGVCYDVPETYWGDIIEHRGTMCCFSGLGSKAPVPEKRAWDPDKTKRLSIAEAIVPYLGDSFEVRVSGTTSIDITRKGIDKAYGIEELSRYAEVPKEEMLFVGDALYPGGNDYPVIQTGVRITMVRDHHHTKEVIREMLGEGE